MTHLYNQWLVGYKVVQIDKGRCYSCSLPIGVRQEYYIGKVTHRREGKWGALAVFERPNEANDYLRLYLEEPTYIPQFSVFKCIYKETQKSWNMVFKLPASKIDPGIIQRESRAGFIRVTSDGILRDIKTPSGTAYANVVMLLREIVEVA